MIKTLFLSTLVLGLAAGTSSASAIFTISQPENFTLNGNAATTHTEQAWDFTTLPGWNYVYAIDSIVITEVFSNISLILPGFAEFQSTILSGPYTTTPDGSQTQDYFIFGNASNTLHPATTETATLTPPYPCCIVKSGEAFTLADISDGGVLGQFDTRVARNGGSFELVSMTISITAEVPEPATFALLGLGLGGLALWVRRRA